MELGDAISVGASALGNSEHIVIAQIESLQCVIFQFCLQYRVHPDIPCRRVDINFEGNDVTVSPLAGISLEPKLVIVIESDHLVNGVAQTSGQRSRHQE